MAVDPLTLEVFLEYGIGMSFLFLRFYARIRTFGVRGFGLDDGFTMLAMVSPTPKNLRILLMMADAMLIHGQTIVILLCDDRFNLLA